LGSLQQRSVPDLLPTTGASQLWERSMWHCGAFPTSSWRTCRYLDFQGRFVTTPGGVEAR
jgi:hypothetical protein